MSDHGFKRTEGMVPGELLQQRVETSRPGAATATGLVHLSDSWKLTEWSDGDLVLARASLKHVLTLIEREAGSRGLMPPTRGVR